MLGGCYRPPLTLPVSEGEGVSGGLQDPLDGAAQGADLAAWRAASGRTGAAFFAPLRAALTGRLHGPELAPLLKAMSPGLARERLEAWAQ